MTARVPVSHDWLLKMSYERRGQCLVVNERREDPLTDEVLRNVLPEVRSYVMLRLLMDGIHYGVVCFYSTRPKAFGERHADIVRQLHNPIAINVGYSLAVYFRTVGLEMSAENRRLRENAVKASEEPLRELLARSPSLESIAQRIRRVAPYDATVIVTGESGCGKEVVATTIQQMSARRNAPFVRVNCAALPGSLIESELFGFERGAFTGARERHAGLFEQADGGTLFLDEVGELPPEVQAKLLRVLQGQSFRRVGGDKEVTVDVRIIWRDEQGPEEHGRRGKVPRGPLLSPQRLSDSRRAPEGEARGHRAARLALHQADRKTIRHGRAPEALGGGARLREALAVAGQRARIEKRHGPSRPERRARHQDA